MQQLWDTGVKKKQSVRNNRIKTKVSEGEWDVFQVSEQIPLQPMKKTIVKQILHLQPVEDPTPEQVDIPEGSVALEGDSMLEQFLKDFSLCEAPTLE